MASGSIARDLLAHHAPVGVGHGSTHILAEEHEVKVLTRGNRAPEELDGSGVDGRIVVAGRQRRKHLRDGEAVIDNTLAPNWEGGGEYHFEVQRTARAGGAVVGDRVDVEGTRGPPPGPLDGLHPFETD